VIASLPDAPVMEAVDIHYRYRETVALDGVSLSTYAGERLVLLGANGSGKSTLLKLLDGLIFPDKGTVRAFGREITAESLQDEGLSRSFRQRVGFLFQNSDVQLFSPSVGEEVAFGPLHLGLPPEEVRRRVADSLHILGLTRLEDRAPYELSGGEKKKVALASVLAINPDVLLLDEPTAGLDPKTASFLERLLNQLAAAGKTIVTATQDLRLAAEIADRVLVLGEDHRLAGEGAPATVLEDRGLLLSSNLVHDHPHRHEEDGVEHIHPHSHLDDHGHAHDRPR
jgi:cobalt/nickel transport system ATP-binding protein